MVVGGAGADIKSTARNGDPSCGCGASPARREGVPVSVVVHPGRLREAMALRGWAIVDLARESRLSPATVSAAVSGRPISARSAAMIGKAIDRVKPSAALDWLMVHQPEERELP